MNEQKLYPLKFIPAFKERIWGGEAWMLSGLEAEDSLIANGFLEGNTLSEILEVYMGDLVGENVYKHYGCLFPLLFKWIEAEKDLSVQVHPNDKMALETEECLGKSEMWFVRKARQDSKIICDFKEGVSKEAYLKAFSEHRIERVLQSYQAKEGDVFFIPSGTVHALGSGLLVAEIQQSSDITYRIHDWDRKDEDGKERTLHTEKALEALRFSDKNSIDKDGRCAGLVHYHPQANQTQTLVECEHFCVNHLCLNQGLEKDFMDLDSFVVYMCIAGQAVIKTDQQIVEIGAREVVLLPACIGKASVFPDSSGCELLETYIPQNQ